MSSIWNAIKDLIAGGIDLLHTGLEPIFGDNAWGWAIIGLTVVVRVLMIPLAVKQFHSMRGMQELSPQIKAVQRKYKTDRSMMRSDPERYRKIQARKNEELQALYKENDVRPAAGCLPLLAQGPIFFALYSVLRDTETLGGRLSEAGFYVYEHLGDIVGSMAQGGVASYFTPPGLWGVLLILGVAGSMFVSQKQMMARRTPVAGADRNDIQETQQKVMLYAMPALMGFFGFNLPVGVLLYWITTNIWTMVQQAIIMREVDEEGDDGSSSNGARATGGSSPTNVGSAGNTRRPADSSDAAKDADAGDGDDAGGRRGVWPLRRPARPAEESEPSDIADGGNGSAPSSSGSSTRRQSGAHLPSRPSRRR